MAGAMGKKSAKKVSRAQVREMLVAAAAQVEVPERCDVVVVGGGAAGLAAAIAAAEAGASVAVFERDLECGRKILATGNGRCNFANEALDAARFNDPQFVDAVCGTGEQWLADVLEFWRGCGLAWTSEEGRLYPRSLQAASVRNALLARARRAGVVLAPNRKVDDLSQLPQAASTIVASGGGASLVAGLGLKTRAFGPVLCPLACRPVSRDVDLDALDGRRARAKATLIRGGEPTFSEVGEVLFRPYGLSGIVVFDLSRRAQVGDVVRLDLLYDLNDEQVKSLIEAADGSADGILDPQVAYALGDGEQATRAARSLDFEVVGPADAAHAQVMRGGLLTSQFDPATLEARAKPGLFACGEALDIDADCGGFNLAWAWKSGMVAGAAAAARAQGGTAC